MNNLSVETKNAARLSHQASFLYAQPAPRGEGGRGLLCPFKLLDYSAKRWRQ